MHKLIIENNTVKTVQQTIEKEVSLTDFIEEIQKRAPMSIPFLPHNTIGYVSHGTDTAFIVEQRPRIQTLSFSPSKNSEDLMDFAVRIPYIYFVLIMQNAPISCRGVYLLGAKEAVISPESELGYLPLPNLTIEGKGLPSMCKGEIRVKDQAFLHDWTNHFIDQLWVSDSNSDYPFCGTPNQVPNIFSDAVKKYTKTAVLSKDKSELAKIVGTHNHNDYMYSWHMLSKNVTEKEFLSSLEFKIKYTYQDALNKIYQVFGIDDENADVQ